MQTNIPFSFLERTVLSDPLRTVHTPLTRFVSTLSHVHPRSLVYTYGIWLWISYNVELILINQTRLCAAATTILVVPQLPHSLLS